MTKEQRMDIAFKARVLRERGWRPPDIAEALGICTSKLWLYLRWDGVGPFDPGAAARQRRAKERAVDRG
jgi:hypothetical protein